MTSWIITTHSPVHAMDANKGTTPIATIHGRACTLRKPPCAAMASIAPMSSALAWESVPK
jgi:hypothetical protein